MALLQDPGIVRNRLKVRAAVANAGAFLSVHAADLDGDGRAEVIAGTEYYWWHCIGGDGESRWTYRTQTGPRTNFVAAGDFNGDGNLEVAAGTEDGKVHVLANADGRPVGRFETGGAVLTLAAADVDGDGIPEIAAASEDGDLYALKV